MAQANHTAVGDFHGHADLRDVEVGIGADLDLEGLEALAFALLDDLGDFVRGSGPDGYDRTWRSGPARLRGEL